MNDIQQRQDAVRRYLAGEKVSVIVREIKKSRKWLHHWMNRYKNNSGDINWFLDHCKAPHKPHVSLESEMEQNILLIRRELMNEKMAQTGAVSIQYEFERRKIRPVPAVWTINRVIAKHGLVDAAANAKKSLPYPELFCSTHQMDLVGPRYIKGDGQFYSVNVIDIQTHSCFVKAVRTKASNGIVQTLASFWQTHGLPDALQMDNELAFRGSNRYPRSFGSVVRFALSQGVAPIFIPVREPWRNGMIEKFNDTYQKRFVRAYAFENLEALSAQEQTFINFHNQHHRYSSQANRTPEQMNKLMLAPLFYQGTAHLPSLNSKIEIPLNKGCVYYIRFIRSDLKIYLPNESFVVKDCLKYTYVVAEVNIENHCLNIRINWQIVQTFPYTMPAIDW